MLPLDAEQSRAFADAVRAARAKGLGMEELAALEVALADQIELRRPVCVASGRCCQFETFGHRLMITTLEMARFLRHHEALDPDEKRALGVEKWQGAGCPFQVKGLCGVHMIRPLGCRIFFCDPASTLWQQEQYERLHGHLKRLHERLGVAYFYVEWREALKAVGVIRGPLFAPDH